MDVTTTINSTIKGKAYEYACVLALQELVSPVRPVIIEVNSSLVIAKNRYLNDINDSERSEMLASAKAGIGTIIKLEPKITEDGKDALTVSIQPDNVAKQGDVRDVLIIRRSITWEIGVSVKHNHEALKHSRLSTRLDFGTKWYGIACSGTYFDEIRPIFENLKSLQQAEALWRDMEDKAGTVYEPLLEAFVREIKRANGGDGKNVIAGLIKYLLGSNGSDYYKLIHYKSHRTRVIPYNLYGKLNQASSSSEPQTKLPAIQLPTTILNTSYKVKTRKNTIKDTLILTMDNGWAISLRIHNASSRVEPSLKFDIQLVGQPSSLFFVDVAW